MNLGCLLVNDVQLGDNGIELFFTFFLTNDVKLHAFESCTLK